MKKLLAAALTCTLLTATPAFADPKGAGVEKTTENALKNIVDSVVDTLTGKNDNDKKAETGSKGRENALNQIDKNIEKHGGSHKGLENARAAVAKTHKGEKIKAEKAGGSAADKTVESVGEVVKTSINQALGNNPDRSYSWKKPAADKPGRSQGKGHNKNN